MGHGALMDLTRYPRCSEPVASAAKCEAWRQPRLRRGCRGRPRRHDTSTELSSSAWLWPRRAHVAAIICVGLTTDTRFVAVPAVQDPERLVMSRRVALQITWSKAMCRE